jgi:hypothetical protein
MACESHPRPPEPMRWRNRRLSDSLVFQQSDLPDFSPQVLSIIRLGGRHGRHGLSPVQLSAIYSTAATVFVDAGPTHSWSQKGDATLQTLC